MPCAEAVRRFALAAVGGTLGAIPHTSEPPMPDPTRTAPPGVATASVSDPTATTGGEPAALGPDPPPLAAGRYVLGEEIARGGMGAVYRATDVVFGREVAVKVLLGQRTSSSGTVQRFQDEARITGQLQHPGIPPAHDLGTLP